MKLKYILGIFLTTLLTSCSDFLEETPETSIGSDGVYNSTGTALGALNGCYAYLADYDGYSFNYFHVVSSTSGVATSIKANDVDMAQFSSLPTNTNIGKMYIGQYKVIGATNDVLAGMAGSKIASKDVKNKIIGESLFIRSMCYFNLVRLFGKVSLITAPVQDFASAQVGRTDVSKVYDQIITDLDSAFICLPEPGSQDSGRPHKYAAKALLAKVYLTLAGNDETSEYWQKAYNAAYEVYGKYELVRPFTNLFGSTNKNNAESIFEVQFAAAQGGCRLTETTFPGGCSLIPNASGSNSWGKTRPTRYMFNLYDAQDPRRDGSFIYGSFQNKDDGKAYILYPTTKADAPKTMKYKQGDSEYPAWKKYIDPTLVTYSNCNFVYMRYADVLLILAETANELGQPTEAAGYLDEVLDRARDVNGNGIIEETEVYPLAIETSISKELLRERIMKERLLELSGECDEWYTVRRRGAEWLAKIVTGHNESVANLTELPKYVYRLANSDNDIKKNLLLPFPSDEISRNENISQDEQNFGY